MNDLVVRKLCLVSIGCAYLRVIRSVVPTRCRLRWICILFVCACAVVCAVEFIPTFKVVIVVVMCRDVCRVYVRSCVCC